MVTREQVQLRIIVATFVFWIILILIVIPFASVEIRFSRLFSVVSPEWQIWKEVINGMFLVLALALICVFFQRKEKISKNSKKEDYILDKRWFALTISIFYFIGFLCALIGTILLIVVIVQYPGKWESVNQSIRIDYEKNVCKYSLLINNIFLYPRKDVVCSIKIRKFNIQRLSTCRFK